MNEIFPIEPSKPLTSVKRVQRDTERNRAKPQVPDKDEDEPRDDPEAVPHIDEYA